MTQQKRFRSPENPRICVECKTGGQICKKCKRRLPLADFSNKHAKGVRYKSGVCMDCVYVAALANGTVIVYAEQPLKRAYYEDKIINGQKVTVREVR